LQFKYTLNTEKEPFSHCILLSA